MTNLIKTIQIKKTPNVGLEPTTSRLRSKKANNAYA